eukprot:5147291-Prymnesium_polylepis.1
MTGQLVDGTWPADASLKQYLTFTDPDLEDADWCVFLGHATRILAAVSCAACIVQRFRRGAHSDSRGSRPDTTVARALLSLSRYAEAFPEDLTLSHAIALHDALTDAGGAGGGDAPGADA